MSESLTKPISHAPLKGRLLEYFREPDNLLIMTSSPVVFMHLACIGLFFVGFSWPALVALLLTYSVRVFALTAGFHRYFSHRAFKTSRWFQFLLAFSGTSAAQLGPLWWAAHHRNHHENSDTEEDIHSPVRHGLFWSHIGWILCRKHRETEYEKVKDWTKYPELMFLDKYHVVAPLLLLGLLYGAGEWLAASAPSLGTSGWQLVMWGFFLSTVMVYHVTFCINSVTHVVGSRRFKTRDESRNSFWLALITGGEGWHNNHHRYPVSARQGMYWWEIDVTYFLLRVLEKLRLVKGLQVYPDKLYEEAQSGLSYRARTAA